MTEERRNQNIMDITDTLWKLNRYKLLDQIERMTGFPVPADCYDLIEVSFRSGAVLMERAVGKGSHV